MHKTVSGELKKACLKNFQCASQQDQQTPVGNSQQKDTTIKTRKRESLKLYRAVLNFLFQCNPGKSKDLYDIGTHCIS